MPKDPVRDRPVGRLEDPLRDRPASLQDLVRDRPAGLQDPVRDRPAGRISPEVLPTIVLIKCPHQPLPREAKMRRQVDGDMWMTRKATGHGKYTAINSCTCEARIQQRNCCMVVGGFCVFVSRQCFQTTLCYLGLMLALALTVVMYCFLSFSALNPTTRDAHSVSRVPHILYRRRGTQGRQVQSTRGMVQCGDPIRSATQNTSVFG